MPSVMVLVPLATLSSTPIWGCISVGKPGWGMVLILVGRMSPVRVTRTASSNSCTSAPQRRSLAVMGSRCLGVTFLIRTSPPVAAAATI